jgi:lipoprotein NlpI
MAELEPENATDHLRLASALTEANLLDAAEPMLRELMDDDPRQPEPLVVLAEVMERRHDYQEAIALCRRAVTLGASEAAATRNLAQLYAETGAWELAETTADDLLRLDPDADYGMLWLYIIRCRQQRPAREAVTDFIDRRDADAPAWPGKLLAFYAGTLTEAELLAAAKVAEADYLVPGQLCEAYFYAGQQRLIDGDKATAKTYFQTVVELRVYAYIEHVWAEAELRKLEAP